MKKALSSFFYQNKQIHLRWCSNYKVSDKTTTAAQVTALPLRAFFYTHLAFVSMNPKRDTAQKIMIKKHNSAPMITW